MMTLKEIDGKAIKMDEETGQTWLLMESTDDSDIFEWVELKDRGAK